MPCQRREIIDVESKEPFLHLRGYMVLQEMKGAATRLYPWLPLDSDHYIDYYDSCAVSYRFERNDPDDEETEPQKPFYICLDVVSDEEARAAPVFDELKKVISE